MGSLGALLGALGRLLGALGLPFPLAPASEDSGVNSLHPIYSTYFVEFRGRFIDKERRSPGLVGFEATQGDINAR